MALGGNLTRPVSEGETPSQSPRLPFALRELLCFKSGEVSLKTLTAFATEAVHLCHSNVLF